MMKFFLRYLIYNTHICYLSPIHVLKMNCVGRTIRTRDPPILPIVLMHCHLVRKNTHINPDKHENQTFFDNLPCSVKNVYLILMLGLAKQDHSVL